MFEHSHIGFIGGGNMGEALIKGLLTASLFKADRIHVYDVSTDRMNYLQASYGVRLSSGIPELAKSSQIVILAVKPQHMQPVLGMLHDHLSHNPLVISVAAGVSLRTLSKNLPEGVPLMRTMPNTPALVLEGASALSRGPGATDENMRQALAIFGAVGKALEVDEKLMDTVTGLSGSGPAYVLLVIEALIDGGVLMGLPRPIARDLVLQTIAGTVKMLQETGKHPAELKDMITSPAGTTISALKVIEDRSVRGALMAAVEAASLRSMEMGKE